MKLFPTKRDVESSFAPLRDEIERNIQILQRMFVPNPLPQTSLPEILEKLEKIKNGDKESLLFREEKTLCYHCLLIKDERLRKYFIGEYLVNHWNRDFILPLEYAVVAQWNILGKKEVVAILKQQRSDFDEHEKTTFSYIENDNAPKTLAKKLVDKSDKVDGAFNYLWISNGGQLNFDYFEDLITEYFQLRKIELSLFYEVEDVLKRRNNMDTTKKVLVNLVIGLDGLIGNSGTVNISDCKNKLISMAEGMIGDVDDDIRWTPPVGDIWKGKIMQARKILRKWQVADVIRKVFVELGGGNFEDRNDFWQRFVDVIVEGGGKIKVYTDNPNHKNNFDKTKKGVARYLSGAKGDVLVIKIGEYVVVDFLGQYRYAFFYIDNTIMASKALTGKGVYSVNNLTNQNLPSINAGDVYQRASTLPNEGRLDHHVCWQKKFSYWMFIKKIVPYQLSLVNPICEHCHHNINCNKARFKGIGIPCDTCGRANCTIKENRNGKCLGYI